MRKNVIAHQEMDIAEYVQQRRVKSMRKSLTKNLAEPIELSYIDGMSFVKYNVCAKCYGELHMSGKDGSFVRDRINIRCHKCKRDIHEGEYISKHQLALIRQNEYIGRREMRDDTRISTEQALKDLGFE
jgi:hypothetical protein